MKRSRIIDLEVGKAQSVIEVFGVKHGDERVFPGSAGVNPEKKAQAESQYHQADEPRVVQLK
jgi:hypothetical protein